MLKLIHGKLQPVHGKNKRLKKQNHKMRMKLQTLEAQIEAVHAENIDLKRRLEQFESKPAKRLCTDSEACGTYYFFEIRANISRRPAGIRSTIYRIADRYNAVENTREPLFCTEGEGTILIANLYFTNTSDAGYFMSDITKLNGSRGQVTCPPTYTPLVLPHSGMKRLFRADPDKLDNLVYTMHDVELERITLR
jgi:hypothetical protein